MNYYGNYTLAARDNAGYIIDTVIEQKNIEMLEIICWLCNTRRKPADIDNEPCKSCRLHEIMTEYEKSI